MKTGEVVAVGTPVSINGNEWLLNDRGEIKLFSTVNEAKDFLRLHGIDTEGFVFEGKWV